MCTLFEPMKLHTITLHREKAENYHWQHNSPCDSEHFPQFKCSVTHADTTARASARTYFYATENKCDDVMKNFISCIEMAGM